MTFQAINDVTRALGTLIESQIKLTVPAAKVSLLPPGDTLPEETGVNLYLYRIYESPFTRNEPWRGDHNRAPSGRPPLGLQLHYLLTPLGKTSEATAQAGDAAHTLLGIAMLALHEHPILNDAHVAGFDADVELSDHLRNSFEDVKVTLSSVTVEDLSKIWATINKPYRLSVAYEVSVVELVPDRAPLPSGARVQRTGLEVFTLGPPQPTGLTPAVGALARLVANQVTANDLVISGSRLGRPGQRPTVRVGGVVVGLSSPATPPFAALTVSLPTSLQAGPQADVVITTSGKASQPLVFVVSPWLSSITPVRTALDTAAPTVALEGSDLTTAPQVRFDGPIGTRLTDGAVLGGALIAPIPSDLKNGIYEVRVQLGGGSQLSNGRLLEVIPQVDAGPAVSVVAGKHHLDISGGRLDGSQIVLIVDGVAHESAANSDPTTLSFTFQRLLTAGEHTVAVDVDGSRSYTVSFMVT